MLISGKAKCQDKISKIDQINGRIVDNIYRDGVINIRGGNELAIELETWSLNLPPDLGLSFTLKKFKFNDNSDSNLLFIWPNFMELCYYADRL